MRPSIALGLLCALFSSGAALTCYECDTDTYSCRTTASCWPGSCASTTLNVYSKIGQKLSNVNVKKCMPSNLCISWSLNFGLSRTTMSTKCCKMDRCNFLATPELNFKTLNGKKCFTCDGDGCTKVLSCSGNEDRCIKATTLVNGQKLTLKGCASSNICASKMSAQVGSKYINMHCCEGNLCNSAKNVGQSVLLLFGSLITVLFFH